MTTSTNEDIIDSPEEAGGAFADALTFLRILLMPVIVLLIMKGWQPVSEGGINISLTLLASVLFFIAAMTDIFDDFLGGNERSIYRRFGYLDDIADTVLVVGTLAAFIFVLNRADMLTWTFLVPAIILIGRELIVGLFKGYELSRYIWPDTKLSNAKSGFSMLAVCLLLSSPWLQNGIDKMRAGTDQVADVFAATSPWVWGVGTVCLWIAACLSIVTAVRFFRTKLDDSLLEEDTE